MVNYHHISWFVGKDVAEILGYSNTRKALNDHVDDEDKGVTKCDTLGGAQEMTIINESGLYSLILSSKLPKAKEFKRWVTSEVLPSIRKHGAYMTEETLQRARDVITLYQRCPVLGRHKSHLTCLLKFCPYQWGNCNYITTTNKTIPISMDCCFLSFNRIYYATIFSLTISTYNLTCCIMQCLKTPYKQYLEKLYQTSF